MVRPSLLSLFSTLECNSAGSGEWNLFRMKDWFWSLPFPRTHTSLLKSESKKGVAYSFLCILLLDWEDAIPILIFSFNKSKSSSFFKLYVEHCTSPVCTHLNSCRANCPYSSLMTWTTFKLLYASSVIWFLILH